MQYLQGYCWDALATVHGWKQTTPEVQQMQQSLGLDEFIEWLFDFSENLKVEPFNKTHIEKPLDILMMVWKQIPIVLHMCTTKLVIIV